MTIVHPSFAKHPLAASSHVVVDRGQWSKVTSELGTLVHAADLWQSQKEEKAPLITDIKSLRLFASQSPVGGAKVAVLGFADLFSKEVANALLKLLEEPPPCLYIVLLSERKYLLPTIGSRVQPVYLQEEFAILEARDTAWDALKRVYDPAMAQDRQTLQSLLYLSALCHTTIKVETILDPYISG
jgi:hypothetical protein